MFLLSDYDYELSEDQIAQKPASCRDASRLMVLDKNTGSTSHSKFFEIYNFISPKDIIVINNTKVIPGRLFGKKETGGKAEILILDFAGGIREQDKTGNFICECLVKTSKPAKQGSLILFEENLTAKVLNDVKDGICLLKFSSSENFEEILLRIGKMPLPPYIKRDKDNIESLDDKTSYQTVYASYNGAVAAPTAGLHFTSELLEKIKAKGVKTAEITLHVGYGTFLPVRAFDIREHEIHSERYDISFEAAEAINTVREEGGKIIAVGTTCIRTLEYASDHKGRVLSGSGKCDLFIYPGYSFKVIDSIITNFHLPRSTLLMLVSAFAGRERILSAYKEAISEGYRFYSYGDAMFIH
ncbi:MAG: tRNA preQ1(34) S-adenosylmethionine ribosyltransferase-isomerase QueA [Desulfobacterium sp.]|nr:tRNA preQ1(34) S-adenosylmethionine ribosyltransferase-isomerase QueA [Desulfobacterium sp.]MBU3949148.1 tRNA preQ1(34) S-adenosylmethionine ribosyltransferase-isomerase QueA [Pseudomonadota bacterium]MBU4011799.1 tRNA preQ1(34) S-adenosylmethionine ribosyltransferase-isomerase QueA [Pseudomonadota bacterium]MBU4036524.1 tRNA preQ1(34) S-adenosylmethionine ribosyltransferase-isomerase QueA [Pseudomonadota bacterium]